MPGAPLSSRTPAKPASPGHLGQSRRGSLRAYRPEFQPQARPGCTPCSEPLRVPSSIGQTWEERAPGSGPAQTARSLSLPTPTPTPPPNRERAGAAGRESCHRSGACRSTRAAFATATVHHGFRFPAASTSGASPGAGRARDFCGGLGRPQARPHGDSQGDRVEGATYPPAGQRDGGALGTGTSVAGSQEEAEDGRQRQSW